MAKIEVDSDTKKFVTQTIMEWTVKNCRPFKLVALYMFPYYVMFL